MTRVKPHPTPSPGMNLRLSDVAPYRGYRYQVDEMGLYPYIPYARRRTIQGDPGARRSAMRPTTLAPAGAECGRGFRR